MKRFSLALALLLLLPSLAFATGLLMWDAPTTNTDGSPLTNLASYKVYICVDTVTVCTKATNGSLLATIPAGTTQYDLSGFTSLRMFFVTAVNTTGQESAESNCVKATGTTVGVPCFAPTTPNAPPNVRIP